MLQQFDAYIPPRWYDEGALVKRGEPSRWVDSQDFKEVDERADHRADEVKVSVGGAIIVNSIVIGAPVSDSLFAFYASTSDDWPGAKYAKHSPSETNQSFGELFAQFRSGVRLLESGKIREVAKVASTYRHKKPDIASWAKKLAKDVKDADD